jgi:hypothetical protein
MSKQLSCLPSAYPRSDPEQPKLDKYLISLAHPTRFERVTFAFEGIAVFDQVYPQHAPAMALQA